MSEHINFRHLPRGYVPALLSLDKYLRASSLEPTLLVLIKTRVSQLNSCAFCIDMHWREAREAGHDERRLALLGAWRSAELFTASERAALGLAEALTLLSPGVDLDAAWADAGHHFEPAQIADLCMQIAETNAWNRISRACGFTLPVR